VAVSLLSSTTDAICDGFFFVDMLISLITALPATPKREEVTTFRGIAGHYFTKVFPYQILPCCVYWCVILLSLLGETEVLRMIAYDKFSFEK